MESVIEHSKEGYYLALRQTQGTIRTETPNWQPWLTFFLRALQQRRLAVKVDQEKLVMATLPELAVQIVDYARNHGRVFGDLPCPVRRQLYSKRSTFRFPILRKYCKKAGNYRTECP